MKGITTSTKPRATPKSKPEDAVDGAHAAVEHRVGDARRDQVNDDQDNQEDDAADGDLGDQQRGVELLGDAAAASALNLKTK